MMGGQVQDDKDFNALVDCILNCVITCLYIKNKFEKTNENNEKKNSGESGSEGAFTVCEFIFTR
jgi:hypothetical protein